MEWDATVKLAYLLDEVCNLSVPSVYHQCTISKYKITLDLKKISQMPTWDGWIANYFRRVSKFVKPNKFGYFLKYINLCYK